MAQICLCCGNKIGLLGTYKLSDEYDKPICDNCRAKFGVKLNIYKNSKDIYELATRKEELLSIIQSCAFCKEGEQYVLSYVDAVENEINNQWLQEEFKQTEEVRLRKEEALQKLQLAENVSTHMLTTGYNFENHTIRDYLGVISTNIVLGTGFLSEFEASISDLFGSQSEVFSDKLEQARDLAIDKLKRKSAELGGNAIIGVDFDYITFSNNMIGVVANGTSVIIELT